MRRIWITLAKRRLGLVNDATLERIMSEYAGAERHRDSEAVLKELRNMGAKLDHLAAGQRELATDSRDLRSLLLGAPSGETSHGWLPRLEVRVDSHSVRIATLERWRWLILGGAAVLAGLINYGRKLIGG